MKRLFTRTGHQMQRRAELFAGVLLFVFMFVVGVVGVSAANAGSPTGGLPAGTESQGAADAPFVQQFEDVPDSNIFSSFINNLYVDNIIGGYACGSTVEPCIPPTNRPYYRPNNNVTRAQMAKYADLGRRNIADALGHSLVMTDSVRTALVISSTTTDSLDVNNASSAEAVQSICTRANQNCYAFYGAAVTGDYAGVFSGGRGV